MAYKSIQSATKRISIKDTLRSKPFRKGFEEAAAGKPFDYSYVDSVKPSEGWRYERGRLLAMVYKGKLKTGNRIENSAIEAYKMARQAHMIF